MATANVRWVLNPFAVKAIDRLLIAGAGTWTLAIDLTDGFATARTRWSTMHKRNAAKAERAELDVTVAETASDWAAYYRIYELSLDRWGSTATSRYPWRLFSELATEADGVRLWVAKVGGEVVAGVLCLLGPQIASYWHGAADARFFPLRPANLLLQEAIRRACDDGFKWFDLGPSGGHDGVERFKTGFGPVRLDVPVLDQSSRPVRSIRSVRRAVRSSRASGLTPR
jgi:predicted N-acyltransferase